MINKDKYLTNFIDTEEKLTASKILDRASICMRDHVDTFTDFIDMYKIGKYLNMAYLLDDINVKAFGGHTESERKIIGFCPHYRDLENIDFPIVPMEILIKSSMKTQISHRDYLGSLLGLGIDRNKIGDILVYDEKAVVFVHEDISFYILNNLFKVKNAKVELNQILYDQVVLPEPKVKEIFSTVSSLRCDAILSSGFQLSRSKIVALIKAEKALLNGLMITPSSSVKEGDFLTLRGYGKIKLMEVRGKTKKERISVLIHRYI